MLNCDLNSLKVAKMASEAKACRWEAWARANPLVSHRSYHDVLVNTAQK
jgi:hypothetical protein